MNMANKLTANEKVRRALRIYGISQWELGEEIGVSEQTIYRYLRKEMTDVEQQQMVDTIEKIARRRGMR